MRKEDTGVYNLQTLSVGYVQLLLAWEYYCFKKHKKFLIDSAKNVQIYRAIYHISNANGLESGIVLEENDMISCYHTKTIIINTWLCFDFNRYTALHLR